MEEDVLALWKKINAFETSLNKSKGRPVYSFYDGPPFATGLPHYGHLLAGTIKDVVCRFAHQTGHFVERRFGWDCHGLPIEFEIEKLLGIKSSHDVKKMGIANYNAECRKIVMRFAGEWEKVVGRMGRWIDFKNDYKTMNIEYMESVWWVFKQLWEKNLVYRGFKVMPYSTACTTPLSNFECNMNYQDVTDPSAVVTFPMVDDENTHFVAWTTTPWTLPSNLALCVNPELDYVTVVDSKTKRNYIFAQCRLGEVYKNYEKAKEKPFTIVSTCKGKQLVGIKYVPLFPFFEKSMTAAFRVVADNYVTDDSGTGVVHCAPGFGEEDHRVCLHNNIFDKSTIVCPVDENGHFTSEVTPWAGRYIKECDPEILKDIQNRGRLLHKGSIVHSYPFCWRSETPLIYKAVDSWFVAAESIRDKLLECNEMTEWVPKFVQTKRFSNWLADAKDWNVSRNRYWGTPLPVWHSDDWEEVVCVGSVKELEELSGATGINDIHREFVDLIEIPSKHPGKPPLKRVTQVFDCWFESGSMPYAQQHYPFENKEKFESSFPAEFIAEGLDQTRGWFYTLLVLSSALFDKAPYRHLVVNGLVLAEDGKKMSKRLKNYPEPSTVINVHGADALRLYLINSPVVRAEPLRFREQGVKNVVKDIFLPFMNATKFFIMSAKAFLLKGRTLSLELKSTNDMDRWISAASQTLVNYIHNEMGVYHLYTVVPGILRFIDELTNWYVRMNRRRLKGLAGDDESAQSLSTLFQVLFTCVRVLAPFTPFLAETVYQSIRGLLPKEDCEDSVHYLMMPEAESARFDPALERAMGRMINVIDLVRVVRERATISMRMPVRQVIIVHPDPGYITDVAPLAHYIRDEINSFEVQFTSKEEEYVATRLDANMATLGKRYKKEAATLKNALAALPPANVRQFLTTGKFVLAGFELTLEDVRVVRTVREGVSGFETNSDNDVVVLVDTRKDTDMINSWLAREFVKRVQLLRKKGGLVITDVVSVAYVTNDEELATAIEACRAQVSETVTGQWARAPAVPTGGTIVAEEEFDFSGYTIRIALVKQ